MNAEQSNQKTKTTLFESLRQIPRWVKLGILLVVTIVALVVGVTEGNRRYLEIFNNPDLFFADQKQQALSDLKAQGITPDDSNPELYYVGNATEIEDNHGKKVQHGDYVLVFRKGTNGYVYRPETGKYVGKIGVGNL